MSYLYVMLYVLPDRTRDAVGAGRRSWSVEAGANALPVAVPCAEWVYPLCKMCALVSNDLFRIMRPTVSNSEGHQCAADAAAGAVLAGSSGSTPASGPTPSISAPILTNQWGRARSPRWTACSQRARFHMRLG